MKDWLKYGLLFMMILSLSGCLRGVPKSPVMPAETFVAVNAAEIDFLDDLDFESLDSAIQRSISYYEGAGKNYVYRMPDRWVDARLLKGSLKTFLAVLRSKNSHAKVKAVIAEKFDVYRVVGQADSGNAFFTGYYEPLLEGSLVRTEKYRYPLYRVPPDLIRKENRIGRIQNGNFVPYYSRYEIDAEQVLKGKNLEIAWVSDVADLFSLHIQGSGKIKLEDGRLLTVGFAQSNGRPFRSVTRFMLESGRIDPAEASYRHTFLQGKSDAEIYDILGHNERYVFFRFLDSEPIGALGEPVTPGRSIATDPDYFPEGALAFIRLRKPVFDADGNYKERVDFSRFVLSQDKGSAIKGPGRVDLFCGFGEQAEFTAGTLKEQGELYLLLHK
jgi:membrane-bound lytic murein transglycosylase A